MSASNALETAALLLYFNNTDHANVGDAAGLQNSATAGSLYVSLHTADPGEAGNQSTSETTYTGYARVAVARSGAGWTVSGTAPAQAANAAAVTFGLDTVGSATITHFGIGSGSSGATELLWSGALAASLAVSPGVTPSFAIGTLVVTND